MTGDLQRFLFTMPTGDYLQRETRSIIHAGVMTVERVSRYEVRVSNRFETMSAPPLTAEQLWQCYDTDDDPRPVAASAAKGAAAVVAKIDGLVRQIRCDRHDTFTAMKGLPATARCDACGEPPDLDSHERIRIRYVETIDDMLR